MRTIDFLLNASWQIPLLTLVAMLACRLMRNGPASYRHAVWVATLIAAVLAPAASFRTHRQNPMPELTLAPVAQTASITPAAPKAPAPAQADPIAARTIPLAPAAAGIVLGAWALLIFYRLLRLGSISIATGRIRRAARARAGAMLADRVSQRCLRAYGLRDVELLWSPSLPGPVALGTRTIILPDSLFEEASQDVLATAIGHEMAHIARHDYVWKVVSEVLYLPVSFHPAAWLIRREIERSREMACDELVTRRVLEPGVYARSIMSIAASMSGLPRSGYTLGVFDGDILEERIRRLVERPVATLKRARLVLATVLSTVVVCAVIAAGLAFTARAQSGAAGELKVGVDAYNSGDFKVAVEHFENAVKSAPSNIDAKLFLAHALMSEFFAEKGAPDSPLMAAARQQYQDVLAYDAHNEAALEGMVTIAIDLQQPKEALEWAKKLTAADPNDKIAWYTSGMLDWAVVFPEFQRAKQAAGGQPQDYFINDAAARKSLRDEYMPLIEDGMQSLQKALDLDPNYDAAMAYTNLLLRLRAAMVDNPTEAAGFMAQADTWVGKAIAAKRAHPPAQPLPDHLDAEGPAPGPAGPGGVIAQAPPPPPPPPPPGAANQIASSALPPHTRNRVEQPLPLWQVVGSTDMPAMELFRQLRAKGFNAMLVRPSEDGLVRVLAGPYADEKTLQQAKTDLENAGFHPIRVW